MIRHQRLVLVLFTLLACLLVWGSSKIWPPPVMPPEPEPTDTYRGFKLGPFIWINHYKDKQP